MLTLQFVPYSEIKPLDSDQRIKRLLKIVKDEKIVVMQGRLTADEEASLIEMTMGNITQKFSGIELCTLYPDANNLKLFDKLRKHFANLVMGVSDGMTVVGPANIVKEIRRNPNMIQLLTKDNKKKRK
jgi:hypothetical protein